MHPFTLVKLLSIIVVKMGGGNCLFCAGKREIPCTGTRCNNNSRNSKRRRKKVIIVGVKFVQNSLYRVSQKIPKTIENDLLLEFQCLALN